MCFFFCVENGVEESAQPTIVRASRDRRRFNQNVCNIFAFICAQTCIYLARKIINFIAHVHDYIISLKSNFFISL